jgi:hypothetical protein
MGNTPRMGRCRQRSVKAGLARTLLSPRHPAVSGATCVDRSHDRGEQR